MLRRNVEFKSADGMAINITLRGEGDLTKAAKFVGPNGSKVSLKLAGPRLTARQKLAVAKLLAGGEMDALDRLERDAVAKTSLVVTGGKSTSVCPIIVRFDCHWIILEEPDLPLDSTV